MLWWGSCSYRPTVSLEYVQQELGFDDVDSCRDFVKKVGVCFTDGSDTIISAKESKIDSAGLARRALM